MSPGGGGSRRDRADGEFDVGGLRGAQWRAGHVAQRGFVRAVGSRFTPADGKPQSVGKRSGRLRCRHDLVGVANESQPAGPCPAYSTLLGWSAGCPVLYAANLGAWRLCGGCATMPIPPPVRPIRGCSAVQRGALGDGMFVAVAGPLQHARRDVVAPPPRSSRMRTIPPREEPWELLAYPVAITPGGTRILIGATERNSICYSGPAFEVTSTTPRPAGRSSTDSPLACRRSMPPRAPSPPARSSGARSRRAGGVRCDEGFWRAGRARRLRTRGAPRERRKSTLLGRRSAVSFGTARCKTVRSIE